MIKVGMLWYDDDPRRQLSDKVFRAAERYYQKHGRWPNTCYVSSQVELDQLGQQVRVAPCPQGPHATIRLVTAPNILPHHYWLGENSLSPEITTHNAV